MDCGMTPPLSEALLRIIELAIPSYPAAELLVFISDRPERHWKPDEIVAEMHPLIISASAVSEYLTLFQSRGIVREIDGYFYFKPTSSDVEEGIAALAQAYRERPVTLIQTIYQLAEHRIQSFADSFRLKKEDR
jgi:hypothetical protein